MAENGKESREGVVFLAECCALVNDRAAVGALAAREAPQDLRERLRWLMLYGSPHVAVKWEPVDDHRLDAFRYISAATFHPYPHRTVYYGRSILDGLQKPRRRS